MKTILTAITLITAAVGLVSCTGVYTDPSYPVVSTGTPIHQNHHRYRRHYHYRHYDRRYASKPRVYVGGGSSISQSHV